MSKGMQIAVGAFFAAILLGWLVSSQVEEGTLVYYKNLEELRASGETGAAARVHGFVVEGSIERDLTAKAVRFRVRSTPHSTGGPSEDALRVV
jgi:cytochrome c-type biogenesis protein CcmE